MIKVFIAEDHPVMREGLKQVLGYENDILVTGESTNPETVINQLDESEWDVIIFDMSTPRNDLDTLTELKSKYPASKVLILSMHNDKEVVNYALETGADGYLNKDSVPEELVNAVRKIYEGEKYIGASISKGFP